MSDIPIEMPGGFAPGFALGFADADGRFALIERDSPLPVLQRMEQAVACGGMRTHR